MQNLKTFFSFLIFIVTFLFSISNAQAATVSWNVDTSGDWSVAANWSGGVVPGTNDDVIIDRPNATVTVTISSGTRTVKSVNTTDDLVVNNGATLVVTAGASVLGGGFNLNGGALLKSQGLTTTFTVNGASNLTDGRLWSFGGGDITFTNLTTYSFSGLDSCNNYNVITSDGAGSTINLSTVTSLSLLRSSNQCGTQWQQIYALNSGVINLSSVASITYGNTTDFASFRSDSGGNIDLSGLVNGFGNTGYMELQIYGASTLTIPTSVTTLFTTGLYVDMPSIFPTNQFQSITSSYIQVNNGSGTKNFNAVTNLDNTRVKAIGQSGISFNSLVSYNFSGMDSCNDYDVIIADGLGSNISFGSLANISFLRNGNQCGTQFERVYAKNGGSINLSSVSNLTYGNTTDFVVLRADGGGSINLSSLGAFNNSGTFQIELYGSSTLSLHSSLNTLVYTNLYLDSTAIFPTSQFQSITTSYVQLNAGASTRNFSAITNFDNTRISVAAGVQAHFPILASYSSAALSATSDYNIFSADGIGSMLDFPTLQTLALCNSTSTTNNFHKIRALNSGVVSLPLATSISIPSGTPDYVIIESSSLGLIDLSSIPTLSSGRIDINANGGSVNLTAVTSLNGAANSAWGYSSISISTVGSNVGSILVPNASSWVGYYLTAANNTLSTSQISTFTNGELNFSGTGNIPNLNSLTNIDNTRLSALGGAQIVIPLVQTYTSSAMFVTTNYNIFNADGINSLIDLPGLQSMVLGNPVWNTNNSHKIRAVNSAFVDLSSVTSLTLSVGTPDYIVLEAINSGWIDLSGVPSLSGGRVDIYVDGGSVNLTNVGTLGLSSSTFNIIGSGSISMPNPTVWDGITLSIPSTNALNTSQITSLNNGVITVTGGSPNFNALTSINNTRIIASGGAQVILPGVVSYDTQGLALCNNWTIITVSGVGSLVRMTNLATILPGNNNGSPCIGSNIQSHTILADGGTVDFPILTNFQSGSVDYTILVSQNNGLITIPTISSFSIGRIDIVANNGAIDIPNISNISLLNSSFSIFGTGTINAPNATNWNGTSLTFGSLAAISTSQIATFTNGSLSVSNIAPNLNNITSINNSRFYASGGAQIILQGVTSYDTQGLALCNNWTIVSATGAGSLVLMPNLTTISPGNSNGSPCIGSNIQSHTILADGGIVSFPMLNSFLAGSVDYAYLNAINSGAINIPSLNSLNSGRTDININNSNIDLSAVTNISLYNSTFNISGTGVLLLPNATSWNGTSLSFGNLSAISTSQITTFTNGSLSVSNVAPSLNNITSISNSRFYASNGGIIAMPGVASYDTQGLALCNNWTIVSATGQGSVVSMSSLLTMYPGNSNGSPCIGSNIQNHTILADGGTIDFPILNLFQGGTVDYVWIRAINNGQVNMPLVSNFPNARYDLNAQSNGHINLSGLKTTGAGPVTFNADGSGSTIDLSGLCTYQQAASPFITTNGGQIFHTALALSTFPDKAILGLRSIPQTSSCTGATCSTTEVFSFLPKGTTGHCLRTHGVATLSNSNLDLDGLARSPNYPTKAFEVMHSSSGAVTGSRLVDLNYSTAIASLPGLTLANREIRAAAFSGQSLYALDVAANELLQINPVGGAIVGVALPLTLNSVTFDLSSNSDIAVNNSGVMYLSDNNSRYSLDIFTGNLTHIFTDTALLSTDNVLPEFSGLAFGADLVTTNVDLYGLNTNATDQIYRFDPNTQLRTTIFNDDPFTPISPLPSFSGFLGDLASVSTTDTTAPGAVTTLSVNPQGDGTQVTLSWTGYSELNNGNDIHHYNIYKSTSNFTNATNATYVGQTLSGNFTYQVNGLTRNQLIYLAVVAVDNLGNANYAVTNTIATTPVDVVFPANPTALNATNSTANSVQVNWTASTSNDIANYRVFIDNVNISGNLPPTATSYNVNGLSAATGYQAKVTAVDLAANQSSGSTLTVATWLNNPTTITPVSASNSIQLSWSASTPTNLVTQYRVYAETSNYTSISGLTPKLTVNAPITSATINALSNGVTYYIAVAAVNISGGVNQAVTTVSAIPSQDLVGPTLSSPLYGTTNLVSGLTVTASNDIKVTATDTGTVNQVEFAILSGTNTTIIGTDYSATNSVYQAFWDLNNFPDGSYSIRITATDSYQNITQNTYPVTLAFGPPAAPVLTAPLNNSSTNLSQLPILGTSDLNTTVTIYRQGVVVAGPLTTNANGAFTGTVALNSGSNVFYAVANGRGGNSAQSSTLTVSLDETVPDAPTNLNAAPAAGGVVNLSWIAVVSGSSAVTYDVYRANNPFDLSTQATKLNSTPIISTSFSDLPIQDGTYYYRVKTVNSLGSTSPFSNQISSISDRTAPFATSITYSSTGTFDQATQTFGPGVLSVTVDFNESLLTTPFLSYAFAQGVPLTVNLVQVSNTQYSGSVLIAAGSNQGIAYAVLSARDLSANQGSNIQSGAQINVDAKGPTLDSIVITPASPIQNDSIAPVSITAAVTLSEAPKLGTTPSFTYLLSGVGQSATQITNATASSTDPKVWNLSLTLPNSAGANDPQNLSFGFSAFDYLDNQGSLVTSQNQFQVYQGNLPPLGIPTGLSAAAKPNGIIDLAWNPVSDAFGYQLFVQTPGSTGGLVQSGTVISATNFSFNTAQLNLPDGVYQFAIASVREANGVQSLSAPSIPVSVNSDSVAPLAPTGFSVQLTGQGVLATWSAPTAGESLSYRLYRANLAAGVSIATTAGLTPILNNIVGVAALDLSPSELEHAYAITAVDQAGNESQLSQTQYLNFSLLPVANLDLELIQGQSPTLDWNYNGQAAVAFNLRSGEGTTATTLVYTGPNTNYVDTGYNSGTKTYAVSALDTFAVESTIRSITLPDISLTTPSNLVIKRGVFNQLNYTLTNNSSVVLSNLKLKVLIAGHLYSSASQTFQAGETKVVSLIVAGDANFAATENITTTIEITPNTTEQVRLISYQTATIQDAAHVLTIDTQDFVTGATGKARFTFFNNSDVTTEIILAKNNAANTSNEVRFKLKDAQGNVYAVQAVKQGLGTAVINLTNGDSVARVLAGQTFVSDWFDIAVPASTPENAQLWLEIDHYHNQLSTNLASQIDGGQTSRAVSLQAAPYKGEIISILPNSSFISTTNPTPIIISGKSLLNDNTNTVLPNAALDLILSVQGFERKFNILTDDNAEFSFEVVGAEFTSGLYTVSVVYPGTLDRPNHGNFTLNGINLQTTTYNISVPRNYVQPFSLTVSAGQATNLTGVKLEYLAVDQLSSSFLPGINLVTPAAANLNAGQSLTIPLQFAADNLAYTSGQLKLRLTTNETGSEPVSMITINYNLVAAAPQISFTPTMVETGVAPDHVRSETIKIKNTGYVPLSNATIQLLDAVTLVPAPSWVSTTSSNTIDLLEVGQEQIVDLVFTPPPSLSVGAYNFVLRVSSANSIVQNLPIVVVVTQSGQGGLLFHVSDIYTNTLNQNNNIIVGVEGARVKGQHLAIPSANFDLLTDSNGEVLLQNLAIGEYVVRVSKSGHADQNLNIYVLPGIVRAQEVFILNNLITIEWSVTEIPLQDRYQINLNLLFETHVPIAVVVIEPYFVSLPTMLAGQVFLGELTITNHGLIQASNVLPQLPTNSPMAQYEFLASVPNVLLPNQSVVVPYRLTALQNFDQSNIAAGSGGSACEFVNGYCVSYNSVCSNGAVVGSGFCTTWSYHEGCPLSGNPTAGTSLTIEEPENGGVHVSNPPKNLGNSVGDDLGCVDNGNCNDEARAPSL